MPFPPAIQGALQIYDSKKGFWRRLFGDQAAIYKVRKLSAMDQTNHLKIYQSFIENLPKPTQASYQVFESVLNYLKQIDYGEILKVMDELFASKLLKSIDLEQINRLGPSNFKNFASIIINLSDAQLLTRKNLDSLTPYYETPEEFAIIANVVSMFMANDHLDQENFSELSKLLIALHTTQQGEHEVRSQGARERRALTGEAGNASRRQVIVGDVGMNPVRDECTSDAGRSRPDTSRVMRTNFGDTTAEIFREHSDSLVTNKNIEKLVSHPCNISMLQLLNNLFGKLQECLLLTQRSLDNITGDYLTQDNVKMLISAVDTLHAAHCLTQKNFNLLFIIQAQYTGNLATVLKILARTGLLTDNIDQLCQFENQFLFSEEAYTLLWRRLENYLPTITAPERKSIFNQVIIKTQQLSPAEEIENYMQELNLEPLVHKKRNDVKFFTAPSRTQSRDNLPNLNQNQLNRQGTI